MTPFKLDSYNYVDNGVYTYGGERIQTNFIVRLLAVPDKLFYHIIKGNKEILSNFFLYARNLIFGTTKVKQSYIFNGVELGTWVHKQRYKYNDNKIEKNRILKLEKLGDWVWK